MVDHFDTVLVLLRLLLWKSFQHFKEDADVVSLGNPISIWIHLQSPCKATLGDERWIRVYDFIFILDRILALSDP